MIELSLAYLTIGLTAMTSILFIYRRDRERQQKTGGIDFLS